MSVTEIICMLVIQNLIVNLIIVQKLDMKKMIALTFVLIDQLGQLSFEQEHLGPHFNLNFFFVCVINWHSENQFDQRLVNITVKVDFHASFPNFINHFMIAMFQAITLAIVVLDLFTIFLPHKNPCCRSRHQSP